MEYKGKLYGKVHKSYFPLEATTDEWDAMVNRISELEAENQSLRQPPVIGSVCPDCGKNAKIIDEHRECNYCGSIS
jgi:hypothetical protein